MGACARHRPHSSTRPPVTVPATITTPLASRRAVASTRNAEGNERPSAARLPSASRTRTSPRTGVSCADSRPSSMSMTPTDCPGRRDDGAARMRTRRRLLPGSRKFPTRPGRCQRAGGLTDARKCKQLRPLTLLSAQEHDAAQAMSKLRYEVGQKEEEGPKGPQPEDKGIVAQVDEIIEKALQSA